MKRSRLAGLLALLASGVQGCAERGAPDWWAAVPPRQLITTPAPTPPALDAGQDVLGIGLGMTDAISWGLARVDALSSADDPVVVEGALEWRTRPGLSEAVQWRLTVRNTTGAWTTDTGFTPAQSWTYRLDVKPKMEPDSAFLVVLEGTRETPEGGPRPDAGSGTARATWVEPCKLLGTWCSGGIRNRSASLSFTLSPEGRHVEVEAREETRSGEGGSEFVWTLQGLSAPDGSGWARRDGTGRSGTSGAWSVTATGAGRFEWGATAAGCGSESFHTTDSQGRLQEHSRAWCWNNYLSEVRP